MRNFRRLLWIVFLGISVAATGQYTKEFKRIFFDAEYLYQTGFYEEAFNRYKNLLTLDPGNSNILFHCGACCLNIPGNENQAVAYLQEAAPGVTLTYKERSHKEPGAPVLTYFMLGRACHLNNDFDKAVENYTLYRKAAANEDPLQVEYAGLQIEACHRAELMLKDAPSFEFKSVLSHFEEELPSCNNPVISGDGNILIFLVDYPNDKKIMMTSRTGNVWSRPRVINSEIGMVGETYPVSLSYDGLELYLVHRFYSHSDVFVSRFRGNSWSGAEALGPNVNGRTSEEHASISRDGKTLYFTSDTRGGEGSLDIYVSKLDARGEWGVATNIGPVINTTYEEHTPFISGNDSILFFSSQGHTTIGGMDVFYSELGADGNWQEPRNLGYPVNTTGDNMFFNPGWNELDGYYAVRRADDPSSNTINMVIELDSPEEVAETGHPREEIAPVITVEKAIEPEETDEILEVLNRGKTEPEVVVPASQVAGSSRLQTTIPFDHNGYLLTLAGMLEVEKVADLMHTYPVSAIHLSGHADATGSSEYNLLLSNQRAVQIAGYLEMRGVEPGRITMEGKGELAPVAMNDYPDGTDAPLGRYLNRQVIATIVNPGPMQAVLSGFYVPAPLKAPGNEEDSGASDYWYTVQVAAHMVPLEISRFKDISPVREYLCEDGYYRYASGEFRTFGEAMSYLERIRKSGYPDAFIQTLDWYMRAVK